MRNKIKTKFKETEIGEIPEGWNLYVFSQAIDVNPRRELKKGAIAKKVSMQGLQEFRRKIASYERAKYNGGAKFQNNDTLMARITPCLENGKTAFVDILDNNEIGFGSTEFNVLCGEEGRTNHKFVYYLSRSPLVRAEAINSMVGTSGRQRVQNDVFDNMLVPIPSIAEQKSIAKVLSDLDSKIELNNETNRTLEAIGQALFKHWFVDFEFPNEKVKPYKSSGGEMVDSELGEIPQGWAVRKIKKCGKVVCGKTPSTRHKENYGDDIAFITIPDMRDQVFAVTTGRKLSHIGAESQRKKELPPLSICVSCIATPGLVSLTYERSHTNQQINSIVCSEGINPYFMYYTMVKKRDQIRFMGLGGTATLNLNTGDFSKIKVIVPDEADMLRFGKFAQPIFDRILGNVEENLNLSRIRNSLLPRLMSGRIRMV